MRLWGKKNKGKREIEFVGGGRPIATGFSGAAIGRLTASMATASQSIDWDLLTSLKILRARSRSLTMNNDYGRKFMGMVAMNVVGPTGFTFTVRVTEPAKGKNAAPTVDTAASKAVQDAFNDWALTGNCDVTGKHSFFDICNMYIKSVARDGEVLMRKIYGKDAGPYGFQLQILDIDRLDIDRNEDLGNGNIIKMGVELNQYLRPVAYHIRKKHPGAQPYTTVTGSVYERVPAADIYHHFVADRPEQNRGLPWMCASITRMQNLGGYEEAAVIAARVGAAKMGFYTSPDGNGEALADGQSNTGQLLDDVEAGVLQVLPEGYDFKSFDPDYPHAMFDVFVKTTLRGVASGLGVAYNSLANDLEGVNFSSIRSGTLEERDNWMMIQKWMIENFLNDLFQLWLKWALLSGAITLPNGSALPVSKYEKFNAAQWQGRRWSWVDPLKDAEASVLQINNGLKSRQMVMSEQGSDMATVFAQLADEQKQIDALGIKIETPDDPVVSQQKPSQPAPAADA
jgi:lambda family phage portal protein